MQLLLLFNVVIPCSTMLILCLFILNMTYTNTCLLRPWCCFLFLIQHCSSLIYNVALLLIHPRCGLLRYLFATPVMLLFLVWHYYSYSSYSNRYFTPLGFCKCGKSHPNSSSSS
jgi:hypothetical protein